MPRLPPNEHNRAFCMLDAGSSGTGGARLFGYCGTSVHNLIRQYNHLRIEITILRLYGVMKNISLV